MDYFDELGVSDLYLSPILRANANAAHGYAVVDFDDIDPRIGTVESLSLLSEALRARGMGILLDVVSNHMSASPEESPWWRDLLEMGPRSRFAHFFDVDWSPNDPELQGRLLVPVLSEPLAAAVRRGLALERTMDGLFVSGAGQRFPLTPESWAEALDGVLVEDPELRGLVEALEAMLAGLGPSPMSDDQWKEKERLKENVIARLELSPGLGERADRTLEEISKSEERLKEILQSQPYRLAPWWEAAARINYRTFFDINDLPALRVEDPEVFAATHRFVFGMVEQGWLSGLRIDHIDGLLDPKGYLDALPKDLYVVVEKILDRHERLRPDWRVEGTTGYDALNQLERLFVHPSGEAGLVRFFGDLTGDDETFEDAAYRARLELVETTFEGEVRALSSRLVPFLRRVPGQSTRSQEDVFHAVGTLIASFPVYRTYLRPSETSMEDWDRRVLESAASAARRRNPETDGEIYVALASVLEGSADTELSEAEAQARRKLSLRFQQLTSPIMAKGVEDTAFYRHFGLLSLNEVGGGPAELVASVEEFHDRNRERATNWPRGLVATTTHDTKRDEDVRARIDVVSEVSGEWRDAVLRWREWNERHKRPIGGRVAPDASEEYLLYQTLIGSWPLEPLDAGSHEEYVSRLQNFMQKALREAKRNTSWTETDEAYEAGVQSFVARVLDPEESFRFLDDFARFERVTRRAGLQNALSRTLLKATMPGVPDLYQGSELWRLSLVDPDNRRPVDFESHHVRLRELLAAVKREGSGPFVERARETLEDGRLKMYLTRALLYQRRERRELFSRGGYRPLSATGPRKEHVVAFARELGSERLVTVVGRFFAGLPEPPIGELVWKDTFLNLDDEPERGYKDLLGGTVARTSASGLPLAEVFHHLPLALLAPLDQG